MSTGQTNLNRELVLLQILQIMAIAAPIAAASFTPGSSEQQDAQLAGAMVEIAQRAISAHSALVGQPIDTSLLKPYVPV